MPKAPTIETLLQNGSAEWNRLRKAGKVGTDHTGATFAHLYSANADLSGLGLVGTEWEKCDLSKVSFKESDLSNAYFHGGRLQDCDFRGANLEGATLEKMKVLRCDFTGAKGLDALELDSVDMDRVVGMDGSEAPPPPPPPAVGVTSFTREQRTAQLAAAESRESDLPMFRPQDSPNVLLARGLRQLGSVPTWVLDVPGLRPVPPGRLTPGSSLESLLREAVKLRLEGRRMAAEPAVVERAQKALRLGTKEAPFAALYLHEVGEAPKFRFSASKILKEMLREELEVNDLTASVDPRVTGALLELKLPHEVVEFVIEVRKRLAACQLFSSLLEAGFHPDNNWEEALEASEPALELANLATAGDREQLTEAFSTFSALPDEARLRRLAFNAEALSHLESLTRLPEDVEPSWLSGPEARECHEAEMALVASLKAADIPLKVPLLAKEELGVPEGTVPEDSEDDLFIHVRCATCGKEKLIVQSP